MIFRTFTIFLLLSISCPSYGLDIIFSSQADISGPTTTLGDIAVLSDDTELARALSSQIVGQSPRPGQLTSFDSRQVISSIIKDNGPLDSVFWKGASNVQVKRKAITITPGKILEIIADYIADNQARLPQSTINFKPESLPIPFPLPTGNLTWNVIPSNPGIIGSTRFTIIFEVDDRVRKNYSIRGHTEAIAPVVVAKRRLKYGDIITPDAVGLASRDISRINHYILDPDIVIGSSIKRALKSGAPVDGDSFEQPPVVRRGEFVKIIVNHSGLVLTATGIAKKNGKKNEIIRVKNTSSNKLIFCRVHAPGLVEVKI